MGQAFILFSESDGSARADAEWVRGVLETGGVGTLTSLDGTRHLYRARVLIVFQASSAWRAMLDHTVGQADAYGLSLIVIARPADRFPWPTYTKRTRRIVIEPVPTEADGAALLTAVREFMEPRGEPPELTLKLFVHAPDEHGLAQIVEIATTVAGSFARPTRLQPVAWDETSSRTSPSPGDAVVCLFANEAPLRMLFGAAPEGNWRDEAETWVSDRALLVFEPRPGVPATFDERLARTGKEIAVAERVAESWLGRRQEDLDSFDGRRFEKTRDTVPDALETYLVGCMVRAWAQQGRPPVATRRHVPGERDRKAARTATVVKDEMGAPVEPTRLVNAYFAVYAPPVVPRDREFILEVWASNPPLSAELERKATRGGKVDVGSKGPLPVGIGTALSVSVEVPSFTVEPNLDVAVWDGRMANTSFVLRATSETKGGAHIGRATVSAGQVPIVVLRFELNVHQDDSSDSNRQHVPQRERRIRTVFASYASDDRVDVLQWARGAELAGVDVFLDVLKLREGSPWETELFNHVPTRDLFCLFWSGPARRSKWVEMEWRCALVTRGLDYIHPVPLADPRQVPPPEELRGKHFNDPAFILREYEKLVRSPGRGPQERG